VRDMMGIDGGDRLRIVRRRGSDEGSGVHRKAIAAARLAR
jgi:hypothetical protein